MPGKPALPDPLDDLFIGAGIDGRTDPVTAPDTGVLPGSAPDLTGGDR